MSTLRLSRATLVALLIAVFTAAEGCRAVEGIFKAGFWIGIIVAVLVVGVVLAVVRGIGS